TETASPAAALAAAGEAARPPSRDGSTRRGASAPALVRPGKHRISSDTTLSRRLSYLVSRKCSPIAVIYGRAGPFDKLGDSTSGCIEKTSATATGRRLRRTSQDFAHAMRRALRPRKPQLTGEPGAT